MNKNFFSILILAFLSISVCACDSDSDNLTEDKHSDSDNDNSNDDHTSVKLYPIEEITTINQGSSTTEYKYDSEYRLIERLNHGASIKDEYLYDDQGRLIKINTTGSTEAVIEYQYGDHNLIVRENNYEASRLVSYYSYEYGENNKLIAQTEYDSTDAIILRFEYEYDEKGNISAYKYFWTDDDGILVKSSYDLFSYTYDDKNGMFKNVPSIQIIDSNVNNKLKKIRTNITGSDRFQFTTSYDITYNEYNYPETITDKTDGNIITRKIKYTIDN